MKALVKKEKKPGIWMEDVPPPRMGESDVLIKILKTSICGTDIHIYNWDAWAQKTVPVPLVIGHEFMGEIADVGPHVKHLHIGQRVCGEGHLVCNHCPHCLIGKKHQCMNVKGIGYHVTGCFAEYFVLPAENVFVLPPTISDDVAAIFDPYGNAVHTAMTFPVTAEDVLITGAGPVGIMAAAVAVKAGARSVVITDTNDYRLELAKKLGVSRAVNIQKASLDDVMRELHIDQEFTVGFEMSGSANGLATILDRVGHGGKIALLGILPPGIAIDWDLVIFKMLTLQGIYGRKIFQTWYQMVHLIESGLNLSPVITHRFPADDFQKGFDAMLTGNAGKVILNWV